MRKAAGRHPRKEIVGLDEERAELREALVSSNKKIICLVCPPGCGKTLLVNEVAAELGMGLKAVLAHGLVRPWSYEPEKAFRGGLRDGERGIVVLDEASPDKTLDAFIAAWEKNNAHLVVLSTEAKVLVETIRSKLGKNSDRMVVIQWGPPGSMSRTIYIGRLCRRFTPVVQPSSAIDFAELARATDGWSFAKLEGLVNTAMYAAAIEGGDTIKQDHFREALREIDCGAMPGEPMKSQKPS